MNKSILSSTILILILFISGCVQTGYSVQEDLQEPTIEEPQIETEPEETFCNEDWECTGYNGCSSEGEQTRTCTDKNDCGTTESKPATSRTCTPPVVEEPTPTYDPCVAIGCPEGTQYVGSKESDKYHYCSCYHVNKILKENLLCFTSISDAKSQGYVPCGSCHPPD